MIDNSRSTPIGHAEYSTLPRTVLKILIPTTKSDWTNIMSPVRVPRSFLILKKEWADFTLTCLYIIWESWQWSILMIVRWHIDDCQVDKNIIIVITLFINNQEQSRVISYGPATDVALIITRLGTKSKLYRCIKCSIIKDAPPVLLQRSSNILV